MSDARSMTPRLPEPKLLIDGESVAPLDGGTVPVTNPATGETFFPPPAAGPTHAARPPARAPPRPGGAPGLRVRTLDADEPQRARQANPQAGRRALGAARGVRP